MAMKNEANATGAEVLGDSLGDSDDSSDGSAFWALAVETWRAEGLSVSEFCRREGLNVSSFYRWRRKLKEEAGAKAVGDAAPVTTTPPGDGALATLPSNNHEKKDTSKNPAATRCAENNSIPLRMKSALPSGELEESPLPSAFVPVRLESSEDEGGGATNGSGVEILIDHRRVLRVERGFDRATLQAVLSVLEAGAC